MKIKCVVAVRNASDVPDFFPCEVEVNEDEYDLGIHYDKAEELASDYGYETYLAYDENDGPEFLFTHYFGNN